MCFAGPGIFMSMGALLLGNMLQDAVNHEIGVFLGVSFHFRN
jgi:hypothetical protein